MKKIYKLFIIIILSSLSMSLKAQNDGLTFSLLPQMPYSNYYNPGIRVPYGGMFGVGLSNISLSLHNSGIQYKNIYSTDDAGNMYIDGIKFVDGLKEQGNCLNSVFSLDVLNAGFRVKKVFINIDWRVRMEEEFLYSKDFVGFFLLGNGNYMGASNPVDFNVGLETTIFSEIGVGVQVDINDHLTIGARPKLLAGVFNANANNSQTKIYTDPYNYAISADVNLDIKSSSILTTDIQTISDIVNVANLFGVSSVSLSEMIEIKQNLGFGIDLGASYVFNKHWGVALAVRDLGFIKWKNSRVKTKETKDFTLNEGVFENVGDIVKLKLDYNAMLDRIVKEVWGNDSLVKGSEYVTYLNTRAVLQGYYEFHPMARLTAVGQAQFITGKVRPSFTIAYSGSFFRFLNLTASYTLSSYYGNALGAGIGFHFGPVNIYAVTDNILLLSKIGKSTVELATSYTTANLRFGIVFSIGKNKNYEKFSTAKTKSDVEEKKVKEEK